MKIHVSRFPRDNCSPDAEIIPSIIKTTIIGSLAPPAPMLTAASKVWSIGSCFAGEIATFLSKLGMEARNWHFEDHWVSAFAIESMLSWIITGKLPTAEIFKGMPEEDQYVENLQNKALPALSRCDMIVITFGISLCWFNRAGKLVMVPEGTQSWSTAGKNHVMRQTTVEENERAIGQCISLIRSIRPSIPIVLTLSPVPMIGTVAAMPVVPSTAVSKAVLRIALEKIRTQSLPNVYYWPSYEIVNWHGLHIERAFGEGDLDSRHVRLKVIDLIGRAFVDFYVQEANTSPTGSQ